ncbi:hypothetical protein ABK040_004033 [Willaertia magna]
MHLRSYSDIGTTTTTTTNTSNNTFNNNNNSIDGKTNDLYKNIVKSKLSGKPLPTIPGNNQQLDENVVNNNLNITTTTNTKTTKRRNSVDLKEKNSSSDKTGSPKISIFDILGELNKNKSGNTLSPTNSPTTSTISGHSGSGHSTTPKKEGNEYFKNFKNFLRSKTIFGNNNEVYNNSNSAPSPPILTSSVTTSNNNLTTNIVTNNSLNLNEITQNNKKLSEKEIKQIKIKEREISQREMMENLLQKIPKNGESFVHINFFDENDQEWQYIGYIRNNSENEIVPMDILPNSESLMKKVTELEGSGGNYGDLCVMSVLKLLIGRGELKYPNGSVYEGDLYKGKRNGFGKMIFPYKNTKNSGIAIGQWFYNNPTDTIPFKVNYGDEEEYWGNITIKNKNFGSFILQLTDLEKTKEGELYNVKLNSKYFGGFSQDLKEGFGVEIFDNGMRYYGAYKNGEFHGLGTLQYNDGTFFHGEFKKGIKKGKGKLFLPNGDVIEGTFSDEKMDNAIYKKGNTNNVELTLLFQLQKQVNQTIKTFQNVGQLDDENFLNFLQMTRKETIVKPEIEVKWKCYLVMNKEVWKKERSLVLEYFKNIYNNGNSFLEKENFTNEILYLLGDGVVTTNNNSGNLQPPNISFIKNLLEFFQSLFHGSYYSGNFRQQNSLKRKYQLQKTLLHNAIFDLKSFVIFLTDQIVWDFLGNEMVRSTLQNVEEFENENNNPEKERLTSYKKSYNFCKEIISNYLHCKVYSTLFELYEFYFRDEDLLMNQKINSLQFYNCVHFGVVNSFIPPSVTLHNLFLENNTLQNLSLQNICDNLQKNSSDKFPHLQNFVNFLQKNVTTLQNNIIPYSEKFQKIDWNHFICLLEEKFTKIVMDEEDWQPGADDITSVYTYIFCKANLGNYTAVFHYINDWKSGDVSLSAVSHVISFMEGFLSYIIDLDINLIVQDKFGNEQFISKYSLIKNLERAIDIEIYKFEEEIQLKKLNSPTTVSTPTTNSENIHSVNQSLNSSESVNFTNLTFSWVSPLLNYISIHIGKKLQSTLQQSTLQQSNEIHSFLIMEEIDNNHLMNLDSNNTLNLNQAIRKYIRIVTNVLENAKLGFFVKIINDFNHSIYQQLNTLQQQSIKSVIVIEFEREPFPSYVYSELSLEIAKFIKFELESYCY